MEGLLLGTFVLPRVMERYRDRNHSGQDERGMNRIINEIQVISLIGRFVSETSQLNWKEGYELRELWPYLDIIVMYPELYPLLDRAYLLKMTVQYSGVNEVKNDQGREDRRQQMRNKPLRGFICFGAKEPKDFQKSYKHPVVPEGRPVIDCPRPHLYDRAYTTNLPLREIGSSSKDGDFLGTTSVRKRPLRNIIRSSDRGSEGPLHELNKKPYS
ncbi:unnamed protein product, partial [Nesidiocoris tenuis]